MSSFTSEILLVQPTPFDPAVANVWGTLLNTDMALIDQAVAGLLSLSVAGNSNVVLTSTNGASDQSRNALFNFTGVLTGNINVLWPNGKTKFFSVANNTTGAFTLSVGVNNSGTPAGAVVAIPQGYSLVVRADGTDVIQAVSRVGLGAAVSGANSDITSLSGLTTPLSIAQGGTAGNTAAAARTALGLGTFATKNETASTSAPSGTPADGDVWFQYAP